MSVDPRSLVPSFPRSQDLSGLRLALTHDWLITLGGADRVLLALHDVFPQAPVYTALYDPRGLPDAFAAVTVRASWLQRIPGALARHRWLLPLMPSAFRSFDLREYDVVLSSSHACAHGVRVRPGAVHICYCHTPMRYAWDLQSLYEAALPSMARPVVRLALARLREWDARAAQRVDYYLANSHYIAGRIGAHYGRDATVIYPPVDTNYFTPEDRGGREDYYLVVSRLVPYKRVDVAVRAFTNLGLPLVVVGGGPERRRLRALGGPTVTFAGHVDDETLREYYRGCRALVFPGEEDFGIVPVEAQACGRPVIALGRGGVLETVLPDRTGVLFSDQTADALAAAVRRFDPSHFDARVIRAHAEQFSRARFERTVAAFVAHVAPRRSEHREPAVS
jgi:glycosyltransferase involved in cell wall biosynthesis